MTKQSDETKFIKGIDDPIFKELITDIDTREYACYIISYLTGLDYDYILNNFSLSRNELSKEKKNESKKTTDIVLKIGNNIINIEANNKNYPGLEERNEMYMASIMAREEKEGTDYKNVPNFYQINIDNFKKYHKDISKFAMMEEIVKEKAGSKLQRIHVSVAKIRKRCYDKDDEIKGNISFEDKLFLILVASPTELKKLAKGNKILEKVREKIMYMSDEWTCLGEYDLERHRQKVINSIKIDAMEKGIEKGMEKGHKEECEKIAHNLLNSKIDLDTISKCTGLSLSEIKNLN